MKILNNFDTKFKEKEYAEAVKKHGADNVLLVQRCFAYLFLKGFIPLIIYGLFATAILSFAIYFKEYELLYKGLVRTVLLFGLLVLYRFFYVFLDYKYDFSIFTCKRIFTYKQEGLLDSDFKDLPAEKIRSIVSCRSGLLGNIFGYGTVEIYTDGSMSAEDSEDHGRSQAGKTKLSYVFRPNKVRQKILNMCVIKN
ncbi:hypothetical protein EOM39_05690 [Candidatus Gracilibacteria bacterium]|nr:hypothetical protein [Candidatus Gracilibacteria bacterium]